MKLWKSAVAIAVSLMSFTALALSQAGHFNMQSLETKRSLLVPVAIIGPDDRKPRKPGDLPEWIENAQGRIYCPSTGNILNPVTLQKSVAELRRGDSVDQQDADNISKLLMSTATLAFEGDYAIVSRHVFDNGEGETIKPENCYFELVSTGEITKIVSGAFQPVPRNSQMVNHLGTVEQDFAVVKLLKIPKISSFIPSKNIWIGSDSLVPGADDPKALGQSLTLVSNAADNHGGTKGQLQPTITACKIMYIHKPFFAAIIGHSNVTSTDCDAGGGSSGASVWSIKNDQYSFIGVYSYTFEGSAVGTAWDVRRNNSIITTFDQSLITSYQTLKGGQ